MADRRFEITVGTEVHSVYITTYKDGTNNLAIQTFDEDSIPYCRVTTNPGYPLEADVVVLRDDYTSAIGQTRDALVEAGVLEMVQPRQGIQVGCITATLYRVLG